MAQHLYDLARDAFLNKQLGWLADDFDVVLTDDTPTVGVGTHRPDLTGVLGSAPITGRTMPGGGVAAAADVSVSGITAGLTVYRVFIVQDSGTPANDLIVWGTDVHSDTMPVNRVSDGNPMVVHWFQGTGRIFRI